MLHLGNLISLSLLSLRPLALALILAGMPGVGSQTLLRAEPRETTRARLVSPRSAPRTSPWPSVVRSPPRPGAAPGSTLTLPAVRTVSDLLRGERGALQRILLDREELKRVRLGRRAAQGELLRLDTVHLELRRRQRGLRKDRGEREAQLRLRVRALHRLVRSTSRRPLLDPRRGLSAVDGRRPLLRIIGRDLQELRRLRREDDQIALGLEDVVRRRREAVAVLGDLARRKDSLQARLARGRQELSELGHLRQNHKGQASEWNAEAFGLEREIVALRLKVQREAPSFAMQKGSLVRPVPGMILTWFGEQRLRGTKATEELRGVEISALPNWRVRAPAEGTVRFAGPVPGYGNVLVIDHDEGFLSVLGHLGPLLVRVGRKVRSAEHVAALAPPSQGGSLRVYLELRSAGRAFDPVPWIYGGRAERSNRGPSVDRRGAQQVVEREQDVPR